MRGEVGGLRGEVGGLKDKPRSIPTKVTRGFTRESLALYPRFIELADIMMKPPAHPWECDFTGTATIRVNNGSVLTPQQITVDDITAFTYVPINYTAAEITVTGAGYIYALAAASLDIWQSDWGAFELAGGGSKTPQTQAYNIQTLSVVFSTDAPSTYDPGAGYVLAIPIAQVSLDTGVAFIDKQILFHNPLINIDFTAFT
jgi:hypothetical protein